MYSYNYNIPTFQNNMRYGNQRFGGLFAPLLLGGVAGYAIGNNHNNSGFIYPVYPYQNSYYNNYYPYNTQYPYYSSNNNNNNYYYY